VKKKMKKGVKGLPPTRGRGVEKKRDGARGRRGDAAKGKARGKTVKPVAPEPILPGLGVVTPPLPVMELPPQFAAILRPPPELTVSEWCDAHRLLNEKWTAEAGPWSTARVPYLREIQDCFADPTVSSICFVKSSRVGGTEFMNNCLAYSAGCRPMPAQYILPLERDVQEEFGGRIRAIFEDSPEIRKHVPRGNPDWARVDPPTILLDHMPLYGAWASSPNTLIRRTCGIMFFDELDNCDEAAGKMGNTFDVAMERLTTFGYRSKAVAVSTPRVAEGSAWKMYLASDQRKPWVPCPLCGQYQVLTFANITIPEQERNPDTIEIKNLAWYTCEHCRGKIDNKKQGWMVARTVWVPKCQKIVEPLPLMEPDVVAAAARAGGDPKRGGWKPRLEGPGPQTRHRGYWINSLYSPWRGWSAIIAKFLRVKDDPEKFRVFKNQWLAEPWEPQVETAKSDVLAAKAKDGLPTGLVPEAAQMLLCGVDLQRDHLYYVIRAWGPGEESWLIKNGTCETLEQVYEIAFYTHYPRASRPGETLRCTSMAVDSGDGERTDEVYEFAKRPGVVAIKGRETADYRAKPSKIEYLPRGGAKADSLILYLVNTDLFKTKAHRLAMGDKWHFHRETDEEYFKTFCAEVKRLVKTKRGGRTRTVMRWAPRTESAPNHYLDCEVYALALADMHNVPTRLVAPLEPPPPPPDPTPPELPPPAPVPVTPPRPGTRPGRAYGFVKRPTGY
jgi:phage terminase large subunit GpA-like protein